MSEGLKTTFDLLSQTRNEAAAGLLTPALDSPHDPIQLHALRAILRRRSPAGQREVLGRLHAAPQAWNEVLGEFRGRMTSALRDAVLSADEQMSANACRAILDHGEYDLIPALINATEDASNPYADQTGETLIELAELLYLELAAPRDYRERRDPQLVRRHVVTSLENSLKRFADHKRRETLEACLMLVNRDNALIKKTLKNPHDAAYLAIVDVLIHSERPGVMRLLLSYLDDPGSPSAVLGVLAHRDDAVFLGHLLKKIGNEPTELAAQNLKRIDHVGWIEENPSIVGPLDDAAQHAAVQMALATGMKRLDVFGLIRYLLSEGKVGGRRAAAVALGEYSGGEANQLAVAALDDEDPQVQAHALMQLRHRGIPGAMKRLLAKVESPHQVVREAVRQSLQEFSFERFLSGFDILSEEVRRSTGAVVKKIDPATVPGLREELEAGSRTRRLRATEVAVAVGAVPELEKPLLVLLRDEDHMIRAAAARALRHATSATARQALIHALADRSAAVQEAAQQSLERPW